MFTNYYLYFLKFPHKYPRNTSCSRTIIHVYIYIYIYILFYIYIFPHIPAICLHHRPFASILQLIHFSLAHLYNFDALSNLFFCLVLRLSNSNHKKRVSIKLKLVFLCGLFNFSWIRPRLPNHLMYHLLGLNPNH